MARLDEILDFIKEYLSEFKPVIIVSEHSLEEEREYINLRIIIEQLRVLIIIREYLVRGNVIAYGYYFRTRTHEEWWDNRPHHPEISTYPHHKHTSGKIEPLKTPSLESFLEHIKKFLEHFLSL